MGVVRSHRPRYERGILLVDSLPMGVTRLKEAGLSLEVIRQPHRLNHRVAVLALLLAVQTCV